MAIITKQKDAFKSVGQSHSQKQVSNQMVGNTYGARQAIKRAAIPPDKVVARPAKPLDKFSKKTDSSSLAQFSPKASFQKVMGRRYNGAPHKPAVLDHIEHGSRPLKLSETPVLPPADRAILKFLDNVIASSK